MYFSNLKSLLVGLLITICGSFTVSSQDLPQFSKNASWITCDKAQDQSNSWIAFRKQVELKELPDKAMLNISVDSKYWLYINEKLVVFEGGLKRGPNPWDTYFDKVDLKNYLRKGTNTFAVLLWYFGKNGFSHVSSGRAGLLFQLDMGSKGEVCSDFSWKCTVVSSYLKTLEGSQPNYRLAESNIIYDARLGLGNWTSPLYNDNGWPQSFVFGPAGCMPWNKLVERPVPQWKDYGLRNFTLDFPFYATGDTIRIKLPYNMQFTPFLKVEAASGKTIEMFTDNYSGGSDNNVRSTYITTSGIQEYESLGWMNGHIMNFVIPKGIKVTGLGYRETGYDAEFEGSFNCDIPFFNTLWKKAARTLYVTMRDNFMDCPDRERAQWWGDLVIQAGQVFYVFNPETSLLIKKAMKELVDWQRSDSILYSPIPAGNWNKELPDQMLASIGYYGFWNYYMNTGDRTTIDYVFESVAKYLDIWKLKSDGILVERRGGWYWGDWGGKIDKQLLFNAWYYLALQGFRNMAEALGKTARVQETQKKMDAFKTAFNKVLWDGKGYKTSEYQDGYDDRGQSLAVLSGLAGPEKYPQLLKIFKSNFFASTYMEKYVLEALFFMNEAEFAMQRMKERFGKMVNDNNYSTLWEGWDIGSSTYGGGTTNHSWSGGGLTMLSQYAAGIEPSVAGFREFNLRPQPGLLAEISSEVATFYGKIQAAIKQTAKKRDIKLVVPEGTRCHVYTPVAFTQIWVNGKRTKPAGILNSQLKSGKIITGDYTVFSLPAGVYNINASK